MMPPQDYSIKAHTMPLIAFSRTSILVKIFRRNYGLKRGAYRMKFTNPQMSPCSLLQQISWRERMIMIRERIIIKIR
jgi:hypothetical protein